jgi:hypothetical protein
MKVPPRLLLAMLAILGAAGCRTASNDAMVRGRPPQIRPEAGFDLEEFVAEHNRNAARIRSLEARPSIGVKIGPPGQTQGGGVDGKLVLERPRNFKLVLSSTLSNLADIGSNNERFWFWFQNKKDKSVYICDYADLNTTSLAVTYQPDWIAEALGLKAITADEAARIRVRPGTQPGTSVLTFPATNTGGQSYARVMIVSDQTHKVNEFRVFAPDGKTMIAQATIKKYDDFPAGGPEASRPTGPEPGRPSGSETCYVPVKFTLEWKREFLVLDVTLPPRSIEINKFNPTRRTALFVEPTPSGYAPVNLAEVAGTKQAEGSTAVRETLPAPESRNRVKLSPPLQIRGDRAAAAPSRRAEPPATRGPLLLPVLDLDVVGAPVPTAPGVTGTAALAAPPAMALER